MYADLKTSREAGYSLLELMVSLGVMLIIVGAAFALIGGSLRFANSAFYMTDAEQSLRAAHESINRDLTSAGDGLKSIGNITVPLSFASNYLTQTTIVDSSDTTHHQLGVLTTDDAIPASTAVPQSSPATNFLANSDRISMLIQDKTFNSGNAVTLLAGKITVSGSDTNINVGAANIGLFQAGEIYAIVSKSSAAFGIISSINTVTNTIVMTNGDGLGLNQTGRDCSYFHGLRGHRRSQHPKRVNNPPADHSVLRQLKRPAHASRIRNQGRRLYGSAGR